MIKQNERIRGSENPHETKKVSRDSEIVTVWSSSAPDRVIEPYCFDDPIVSCDSYLQLLNNYLVPTVLKLPANIMC